MTTLKPRRPINKIILRLLMIYSTYNINRAVGPVKTHRNTQQLHTEVSQRLIKSK